MATTFESISLQGLRIAHLKQLLSYVYDRELTGAYYGNTKQFEKRHIEIRNWLERVVKYATSEVVKLPIAYSNEEIYDRLVISRQKG